MYTKHRTSKQDFVKQFSVMESGDVLIETILKKKSSKTATLIKDHLGVLFFLAKYFPKLCLLAVCNQNSINFLGCQCW